MKKIERKNFRRQDVITDGVRYLVGNGYFGYRGTLDEFTKAEMVSFNLNGLYDRYMELWRESVNAYNPLYTFKIVKNRELNPTKLPPESHIQGIDIETGLFFRETVFAIGDAKIKIRSERFADQKNKELLYARYVFSSSSDIAADIYTGIDLDIYNLSGMHLEIQDKVDEAGFFFVKAKTMELGIPIVVGETSSTSFSAEPETIIQNQKLLRRFRLKLLAGEKYEITKYTGVCHTRFDSYEHLDMLVTKAQKLGFRHKFDENRQFWLDKWKLAGIEISGDEEAEIAVNYSIYQLISSRPYSDYVSIPARGVSGQAKKGAVNWDAEIFMLPFFMNTDPESARHMIMYRILGLQGAIDKATQYGYKGAFYAMESQERGSEACSDYNVTDAITGEPIRTYFRERQIHLNGAMVYALANYIRRTDDVSVLFLGGLEMIIECARFYLDYLEYNKDTKLYEALNVVGPDEYHEKIDNNAYTNYMIDYVFEQTDALLDYARQSSPKKVATLIKEKDYTQDIVKMRIVREKLFLPEPDEKNIVEQFAGYFDLEDVPLTEIRKQMRHPNEYLGGEDGLATPTKIIKQSDVVTMMVLLPERFSRVVKKANFAYYEPLTESDHSLSASMQALIACDVGRPNFAYPFFLSSAQIDMLGKGKEFSGGIYIGGTHLAACGGAYLSLIYGFCGLKHRDFILMADTRLTSKIKEVRFHVYVRGRIASVKVSSGVAQVTWEEE